MNQFTEMREQSRLGVTASVRQTDSPGEFADAARIHNGERQTDRGENSGYRQFERSGALHNNQFRLNGSQFRCGLGDTVIGKIRCPFFSGGPHGHINYLRRRIQSSKSWIHKKTSSSSVAAAVQLVCQSVDS